MSIVTLPNQPLVFDYPINECDSCDERDFCNPVIEGDTVDFQIKQTACGSNLICDPRAQLIGDQLVTNGTFTGSAAGWTLGVAWSYGANIVSFAGGVGHGILSQTIATALVQNKYYIVRFTISNLTGTLSLVPDLGNSPVVNAVDAAGTYEMVILCGAGTDLEFIQAIDACTFDIDDIELYELAECWTGASGWVQETNGGLTHTLGTTSISQVTPPLTAGYYYEVKITIYEYVSGTIVAVLGTQQSDSIGAEGTTTVYVTANNTGFSILPTNDFVGTITYVSVKKLKNDFTFGVIDLDDMTEYTATDEITYYHNWVTAFINAHDWIPVDSNCFKIVAHDLCTEIYDDVVTDGAFINGLDSWVYHANWFDGFHSAWAYSKFNATGYQNLGGGLQPFVLSDPTVFPTVTSYYYKIIVSGTVDAISFLNLSFGARLLIKVTAPGTYEGIVNTGVALNNLVSLATAANAAAPLTDLIYVHYIEVRPVIEVDRVLTSNCFTYINGVGCTRLIKSYCDENGSGGFNFVESLFQMKQRISIVQVNPIYQQESTNYLFSNGVRSVIYAQSEKYWSVRTDYIPEWMHDCFSFQIIQDHLFMDDLEMFDKGEDYVPDYAGDNDYVRVSSVSREWKEKSKTIFQNFNNNV